MDMRFQARAAWRGRGRPPREPSERVLELLRYTDTTNTIGSLAVDDIGGTAEVREILADLRAAGRVLGGKVHYQIVRGELRFFWEPEPADG